MQLKLLRHAQHASAVSYGTPEVYEHHFNEGMAEVKSIGTLLFPWVNWEEDAKSAEYRKIWEDWFGIKVGSPEWEELEKRGEMLQKIFRRETGTRGRELIEA